jgi:hypothetical protein
MTIPFLRHLPGLNGSRTQQVVTGRDSRAAAAKAAIDQLLEHLPDLLVATVVDVVSGTPLASYAAERRYQSTALTAAVVAAAQQVQANLATQEDSATNQLHEILLTLSGQLHLSCLGAHGQLLYLAADSHDTNLAIARQLARQAIDSFDALQ